MTKLDWKSEVIENIKNTVEYWGRYTSESGIYWDEGADNSCYRDIAELLHSELNRQRQEVLKEERVRIKPYLDSINLKLGKLDNISQSLKKEV